MNPWLLAVLGVGAYALLRKGGSSMPLARAADKWQGACAGMTAYSYSEFVASDAVALQVKERCSPHPDNTGLVCCR